MKGTEANPSCSHHRAIVYFIESMQENKCEFEACPCASYSDFKNGTFLQSGQNICTTMGYNIRPVKNLNQTFYLNTNTQNPFCRSDNLTVNG